MSSVQTKMDGKASARALQESLFRHKFDTSSAVFSFRVEIDGNASAQGFQESQNRPKLDISPVMSSVQTEREGKALAQGPQGSLHKPKRTSSATSLVQAKIDGKVSVQGHRESQEATQPSFESQKWMNDFWSRLQTDAKAQDDQSNAVQTAILHRNIGRIQQSLQKKLARKQSTSVDILSRSATLSRRTQALQARASEVREHALVTIHEVGAGDVNFPKLIGLSENSILHQWVPRNLAVLAQLLVNDAVDASTKSRLRKVRQSLWTHKTLKLDRVDLKALVIEAALMVTAPSRIAKYKRFLDDDCIEASFRPRVVEIIEILQSCKKDDFRKGKNSTGLSGFEKEIKDYMKVQA